MSVLHSRVKALSRSSERDLAVLWRHHLDGVISEHRFAALGALLLAQQNHRAVTLADLAITAAVIRHLRDIVPPLGLQPTDVEVDVERLTGVIDGVLTADIATAATAEELAASRGARLAMVARTEPATTAQNSLVRAMAEREIPGWTRELSPGACPLCQSLAGDVLPASAEMVRHAGCTCVPTPVFT